MRVLVVGASGAIGTWLVLVTSLASSYRCIQLCARRAARHQCMGGNRCGQLPS